MKLISLFLLLAFSSAMTYAIDFSVPLSVYQQAPASKYRLSETAYRQFRPIQKQISAEQYDDAFTSLNRLVKRHKQHPYVVSVAIKTAAYIYISQQEYSKAMEWMQQVLKLSSMSTQELQIIRHDLSQLQLQAEQYQNALNTMERWLQEPRKSQVSAVDYQRLAVAHFQLKHYKKAKQAAYKGLKKPNSFVEPLYRLILACDFELKNYALAERTLSTLVKLNPSHKNYWIQWAGVLDQLNKPDKALVIFELMDKRSMLNNEQERVQFVQRLMQQDNAFKAASRLNEYMKSGELAASIENQLLLSSAWTRSGENILAIERLKSLISTSENDEVLMRLAQIYVTEQKWAALVQLLEAKLKTSVTEENEQLYLQLGYGYVQLEQPDKAMQTFLVLATSKQSSKEAQTSANQWLRYLNQR